MSEGVYVYRRKKLVELPNGKYRYKKIKYIHWKELLPLTESQKKFIKTTRDRRERLHKINDKKIAVFDGHVSQKTIKRKNGKEVKANVKFKKHELGHIVNDIAKGVTPLQISDIGRVEDLFNNSKHVASSKWHKDKNKLKAQGKKVVKKFDYYHYFKSAEKVHGSYVYFVVGQTRSRRGKKAEYVLYATVGSIKSNERKK